MNVFTYKKILIALSFFFVLAIFFLPEKGENTDASYLWNKQWKYIDYFEDEMEFPRYRFVCDAAIFKDDFYIEMPSMDYLQTLQKLREKNSSLLHSATLSSSEVNKTVSAPNTISYSSLSSLEDLKLKGEPKYLRFRGGSLVRSVCNDFIKVNLLAYYNSLAFSSLKDTKDTTLSHSSNSNTNIEHQSLSKVRDTGLDDLKIVQKRLNFSNYRTGFFAFLGYLFKGETLYIGSKIAQNNGIFIKQKSLPDAVLILSENLFSNFAKPALEYRSRDILYYPINAYTSNVKFTLHKVEWETVATSDFHTQWKTFQNLKHYNFEVWQIQYKDNKKPTEWNFKSKLFSKQKIDQTLGVELDSTLKQINIDSFNDEPDFFTLNIDKSKIYLEFEIKIEKGGSYNVTILDPSTPLLVGGIKYYILMSSVDKDKHYIRQDKVRNLIDNLLNIENRIRREKENEEKMKATQKQIKELKLKQELMHKTLQQGNTSNTFSPKTINEKSISPSLQKKK